MSNDVKQKLIIITGSPCVGKSAVSENLLYTFENSAYLDDDSVWLVNPFSFNDPRNQIGYKNMSFVLSNYLNSNFDYVIFSSVRMISNRDSVLKDITARNYTTIGFTLKCSEETLVERHKKRGDNNKVSFEWLRLEPYPNDYIINTDNKTVIQIVNEIKSIIIEHS